LPCGSFACFVPAKDEGARIRLCLESVLKQDYPNFSVIAIDDRSTDETGREMDAVASEHANMKVVHVADLPKNWLGKCHALWAGTKHANDPQGKPSEWLLFVDSDVTIEPNALSSALSISNTRNYDMLTVLTALECPSFWERLILPVAAAAWSIIYTISVTNNDNRPDVAAANGQFILMRRSVYDSIGGHEAVRTDICEDVELARLLKSKGYSVRFFAGAHLAATRMHSSMQQMFHGWGRIYSGSGLRKVGRLITAMLVILLNGFSVYAALAWGIYAFVAYGEVRWLVAALVHFGLLTWIFAKIYRWSHNTALYAPLFPISGGLLLALFAFALHLCRTGKVQWRNTTYDLAAMAQSKTS
ncbi:MAG TPA: glycosyltransferase family A protein, partial [Tepidisphaeraceae bacterium]|nr:glycosyltransferase family A protein [Tepidisphaeraceae bacterium]